MAMLLGPRARVLETLLALLLMATATGAAVTNKVYGSKCSSSLECGSSAPFCQIYLTDESMAKAQAQKQEKSSAAGYLNVKPTTHGFCTECEQDCDCGVGEYCAVDTEGGISVGKHAKLAAENNAEAASELTQDDKDEFLAVSKAFEGMKLQSKCKKMKISKTSEQRKAGKGMQECMPSLTGKEFGTQVDYRTKASAAPPASATSTMRLEGCRDDGCCRMEVYHDSQWGTICDDSFDGNDATVACRQLGCQAGTRVSNFGGGTGQIWMNYHSCDGTETKLEDCSSAAWGNSYGCDHSEDVGVCCTSCPSPSQPSSSSDFIMTRKLMTPDIWYTGKPAAVAQFCGHIYEHALNNKTAFYERIDDSVVKRDYYANDKELLKPDFMSPGVCSKAALFKDNLIKQCSSRSSSYGSGYYSNLFEYKTDSFQYSFTSPAIAWWGNCKQGECQVCKEGESRCTSRRGIHQECSHGKWKASVGTALLRGEGERFLVAFFVTVFVATALLIIIQCTQGGLLFKISLKAKREVDDPPKPHDNRAPAREFEMGAAGTTDAGAVFA